MRDAIGDIGRSLSVVQASGCTPIALNIIESKVNSLTFMTASTIWVRL